METTCHTSQCQSLVPPPVLRVQIRAGTLSEYVIELASWDSANRFTPRPSGIYTRVVVVPANKASSLDWVGDLAICSTKMMMMILITFLPFAKCVASDCSQTFPLSARLSFSMSRDSACERPRRQKLREKP